MTIRFSTGLRNAQASGIGFQGALNKGYMHIYTGAQPASADAAFGSTLLGIITIGSAPLTKETRATGSVTITGATGGQISAITVGGLNIIPDGVVAAVVGDTAATAVALGEAVNRNAIMEARVAGSVVTLYGRPGTGVITAAVAGTLVTVTATYVAMGSGVTGIATANALILTYPSSGVISKPALSAWSMNGIAVGTAGWFRYYSSDTNDTGQLLTGAPWYSRFDGTCGVGSGDAQLSSLAVTSGSPHTVDVFTMAFTAA